MADTENPRTQGLDVGSLPPLGAPVGVEEQLTGLANRFAGPGSRWEQLTAKIGTNSIQDSPEGLLGRYVAELALKYDSKRSGDKKWSPEELNDYFSKEGFTDRFTESEYLPVAMMRVDQWRKRKLVDEYVARGKPWGAGWELLSGVPQGISPLNILAGMGAGRAAAAVFGSAVGKSGLARVGRLFAENAVGNLAVDIPAYEQMQSEFTEATRAGVAAGSLAGAALGTGIQLGVQRIFSKARPEIVDKQIAKGIAEHESGAKIEPVHKSDSTFMGAEIENGTPAVGVTGQAYVKVNHPSEVPFYVNVNKAGDKVEMGEYGQAIYASDSPYAKNNNGDFVEARIKPDAKFLDLGKQMTDPEADVFKMAVEMKLDRFGVKPLEMPDNAKLSDLKERLELEEDAGNLPDGVSATDIMREVAQDMQYDGFLDVHSVNGSPRYTKVTAFHWDKIEYGKTFAQNKDLVPKMDVDEFVARHNEYISNIENKNTYNPEILSKLKEIKSRPDLDEDGVKTLLKQFEIKTRAELKRLVADMSQSQGELDIARQAELELPAGKTDADIAAENQLEFDQAMKQIDEFIDSERMKEIVARITDDELGKMRQLELEGLRGSSSEKKKIRRSNLPDKDKLARMSAEEYRASIEQFADEQPDMFNAYYFGVQGELNLPAVPFKRMMSTDEMGRLYLAIQPELPLGAERLANMKKIVPPPAPTPQARKIVNGKTVEAGPIPKEKLEQVSKNIKEVTPSLIEEMKLSEATKKLIQAEEEAIDTEFKENMKDRDAAKSVVDCMVGSLT